VKITKEYKNDYRSANPTGRVIDYDREYQNKNNQSIERKQYPYHKKQYVQNRRNGVKHGKPYRKPNFYINTICTECKSPTRVPFKPDGIRPVYCKTCLRKTRINKSQQS
jgi:CxxC-x17-CxxC domain-containing protein